MHIRRLNKGYALETKNSSFRIFWTGKNWRAKPHPYWFTAKYSDGSWTIQSMRLEIWRR